MKSNKFCAIAQIDRLDEFVVVCTGNPAVCINQEVESEWKMELISTSMLEIQNIFGHSD